MVLIKKHFRLLILTLFGLSWRTNMLHCTVELASNAAFVERFCGNLRVNGKEKWDDVYDGSSRSRLTTDIYLLWNHITWQWLINVLLRTKNKKHSSTLFHLFFRLHPKLPPISRYQKKSTSSRRRRRRKSVESFKKRKKKRSAKFVCAQKRKLIYGNRLS